MKTSPSRKTAGEEGDRAKAVATIAGAWAAGPSNAPCDRATASCTRSRRAADAATPPAPSRCRSSIHAIEIARPSSQLPGNSGRDNGTLVGTRMGTTTEYPLTKGQLRPRFDKACEKAGIDKAKFQFRDLRGKRLAMAVVDRDADRRQSDAHHFRSDGHHFVRSDGETGRPQRTPEP